jgi:hypothetical protein
MGHDGADWAGVAAGCWALRGRPGPFLACARGPCRPICLLYLLSRRIKLRQLSFDVCGLLFGQANSLSAINLRRTLSLSIPDHQATLSLPYHEATTGTALAISFNFLGAVPSRS